MEKCQSQKGPKPKIQSVKLSKETIVKNINLSEHKLSEPDSVRMGAGNNWRVPECKRARNLNLNMKSHNFMPTNPFRF